MASAPDIQPDSSPNQAPPEEEGRGDIETVREDTSEEVESDGAGGTARE